MLTSEEIKWRIEELEEEPGYRSQELEDWKDFVEMMEPYIPDVYEADEADALADEWLSILGICDDLLYPVLGVIDMSKFEFAKELLRTNDVGEVVIDDVRYYYLER